MRILYGFFVHALAFLLLTGISAGMAQQASPPPVQQPADTAQTDTSQAAADTLEGDPAQSSQQFLLPSTDALDTEHGYNLKVTVRMAPVYEDSTLVSQIVTYLPEGSVVGVVRVLDNWYRIEYGPEEDRKNGWLISYGVERTHEMEHIVTSREDQNRWEGLRVVVMAGETPIRSFPSSAGDVLVKAYRNEIFEVSGANQDYYMVKLSNAVNGWVWRGDVESFEEPKYTAEQIQQMYANVRGNKQRIDELGSLIGDLELRETEIDRNLEQLAILDQRMKEEAARQATVVEKKPFFQFDSVKNRISLQAGFLRQGFDSGLGLDMTMMMGFGLRYRPSEKLSFEVSRFSGDPALLAPGEDAGSMPAGLIGLDTLTVSGKFWQLGARYEIGGLRGVPLLSKMDNYLYGGLGFLTLKPQTAGYTGSQSLWGPVLGWGFTKGMFGALSIEAGLRVFLSQTEVTDVRLSGSQLLQTESVFLKNIGFNGGVSWQF